MTSFTLNLPRRQFQHLEYESIKGRPKSSSSSINRNSRCGAIAAPANSRATDNGSTPNLRVKESVGGKFRKIPSLKIQSQDEDPAVCAMKNTIRRPTCHKETNRLLDILLSNRKGANATPHNKLMSGAKFIFSCNLRSGVFPRAR